VATITRHQLLQDLREGLPVRTLHVVGEKQHKSVKVQTYENCGRSVESVTSSISYKD